MRVLGIETSCDETSVAVLDVQSAACNVQRAERGARGRVKILHHEIASQIGVHALYGGVVPEVAARLHVAETIALLDRAIGITDTVASRDAGSPFVLRDKRRRAGERLPTSRTARPHRLPFDAIAVTQGPGLATALRVGIEAGRAIAFVTDKPIIGVNHLEGHLASAWLVPANRTRWRFPILSLLVSGGHSELVLMHDFCTYRVLGRTRDDAAGEAFDKTAKLMGLGYPGGPAIAKAAEGGDPSAFTLPRPMMHGKNFDFSFSGLKTAVRREWESLSASARKKPKIVSDLAASVQQAIIDVLVAKTIRAVQQYHPAAVTVVGGVSANRALYAQLKRAIQSQKGTIVMAPAKGLHTDNAAMIAAAGAWRILKGARHDWRKMDAKPEWDL